MGIYVDEIYSFKISKPSPKIKKESNCTFRRRLGSIIYGKDHWWELKGQPTETSDEIIIHFQEKGLAWFEETNTRSKIYENGTEMHRGAKLDIAIMRIMNGELEKGKILFEEYYQSVDKEKIRHLSYLDKMREKLKIK